MARLWIVDRDSARREALLRLAGAGVDAFAGAPGERAFEQQPHPDVVVLGLGDDFELELDFAHRYAPRLATASWIIVSEAADAGEARRLFDDLSPQVVAFPGDVGALRRRIEESLRRRPSATLSERRERESLSRRFALWFDDLELPELLRALDQRSVSLPVLILGEPGTGRGLLARYVAAYARPELATGVSVGCRQVADAAELRARIDAASARFPGGTLHLVLEDVDRLPEAVQLELRSWVELGTPPGPLRASRVRWIATAGDPSSLEPGLERALAGVRVRIPPLRERPRAVQAVALGVASASSTERGEAPRTLSPEALDRLRRDPWPGNLRELESVLRATLASSPGDPLRAEDLRFEGAGQPLAPGPPPSERSSGRVAQADSGGGLRAAGEPPRRLLDAEALPRLAGAVAHEVGNPLVGIRTFARILPERFQDAELERFAVLVGVAVDRIARVVERLSRFAELGAPARTPVDLASLVDALLDERRAEIQARGLVVLKQLEPEHARCSGDEAQLRFALAGVLERVLSLVPERGDLYVATRKLERGPGGVPGLRLALRFRAPQGLAAQGGGVSLAEAALEFALADAVLRSHGGVFEVVPGPGSDTTLQLDLPA